MPENSNLLDTPRVDVVSDQLCIPVTWAKAEALQTHLRRNGIRTTVHLDAPVRAAWLEVWPGLWHIFALQGTFPESRQAMQRLGSFLAQRLAARAAASPATQARAEKTAAG